MTTDNSGRCAACGARLAPGADWCSLCLTPVAATPTGRATAPAENPAPRDPAVPRDPVEPDAADPAAAERMLAQLRAESVRQRPLGAGRLAGSSRGALLGLGVLVAIGASAVVVGLLWLLGLAL